MTDPLLDRWVRVKGRGTVRQILDAVELAATRNYPIEWFGVKAEPSTPPFLNSDTKQQKLGA